MAEEKAQDNKQAAKNAARSAADLKKQKKKKWCPIVAPEAFGSRLIGESLVYDASLLMNKSITVSLMHLTGDMKKQNINIMFKVTDIKEGKGLTKVMKYEMSPSSLRRLAKRDKNKITDSFVVKTADGFMVRIKTIMITNAKTKSSVLAALVKNCRAVCKEMVNKTRFEQMINELVSYKFQKEARDALHRTYPLRNLDIKSFSIETKKKKETVEEELLLRLAKEKEKKQKDKEEEEAGKETGDQAEEGRSQDQAGIEENDSESDESEAAEESEAADASPRSAQPDQEDQNDF